MNFLKLGGKAHHVKNFPGLWQWSRSLQRGRASTDFGFWKVELFSADLTVPIRNTMVLMCGIWHRSHRTVHEISLTYSSAALQCGNLRYQSIRNLLVLQQSVHQTFGCWFTSSSKHIWKSGKHTSICPFRCNLSIFIIRGSAV